MTKKVESKYRSFNLSDTLAVAELLFELVMLRQEFPDRRITVRIEDITREEDQ